MRLPLDCHWTAIGLPLFWAPRTAPAAWHYHLNQPTRWGHFCLCCSWWNSTPKCPIARRINSDRTQAKVILCLRVKLQASVNYLVAILLGQAPRNRPRAGTRCRHCYAEGTSDGRCDHKNPYKVHKALAARSAAYNRVRGAQNNGPIARVPPSPTTMLRWIFVRPDLPRPAQHCMKGRGGWGGRGGRSNSEVKFLAELTTRRHPLKALLR